MAEPSTHINYSFEDIQRYLQGKMSAAEMHDIERAALQDPFLADAIEGFNKADAAIAKQHLNDINIALLKDKKESKVVAFNKKTRWLNVAAVIIVLGGIGVVASFFLKSSNKQTQVAQIKNKPAKNELANDSVTSDINELAKKPDTTLLIAENKVAKKTERLKLNNNVIKNNVADNKMMKGNDVNDASVAAATVALNQSNQSPTLDSTQYNLNPLRSFAATAKASNNSDSISHYLQGKVSGVQSSPTIFSGKVVDQNGDPVPYATIRINPKQAVATDAMGFFNVKNNDTALSVITSAVGYTNNASVIEPAKQNVIMLSKNNFAMNDVVVTTALGVSRKQKSFSPFSTSDSAMPVGGWENFHHYVLNQLNKDSTKENYMNKKDEIELEFLVDNAGNPYNIKIIKSLDDERNSKAIDILKSGPKWISTSKKKKATVSIEMPKP